MISRLPDPSGSSALLVGASRFANPGINDLPAVANNLNALAAALTDPVLGVFDPLRCDVLLDPANAHEMDRAVIRTANSATDTVLIYYAGHGLLSDRAVLHLAVSTTDPELSMLRSTAVPVEWLRNALAESPARNRILILDCCYSGRAAQAQSHVSSAVTAAIEIAGTYTITSAPSNSSAVAPVGAQFTAFTGELVGILTKGSPDRGALLSLSDIYEDLVRTLVPQGLPRPQQLGTGLANHLALARNPAGRTQFHQSLVQPRYPDPDITEPRARIEALQLDSDMLNGSNPSRTDITEAERLARRVTRVRLRDQMFIKIARVLTRHDADAARRIAHEITDKARHREALEAVAQVLATRDMRAAREVLAEIDRLDASEGSS